MEEDDSSEETQPVDITVFGSVHVSENSVEEMKAVVNQKEPDVVAVELGMSRFKSYLENKENDDSSKPDSLVSSIKNGSGITQHLLLRLLWEVQNRTAEELDFGTTDADMQQAVDLAIETDTPVALIDRDLNDTMDSYFEKVSRLEIVKTMAGLISGIVSMPFVDTEKAVDSISDKGVMNEVFSVLEKKAPAFYESYIEERNVYLAKNIEMLRNFSLDTVAVIGAGHEEKVNEYLSEPSMLEADIRDKELRPGFSIIDGESTLQCNYVSNPENKKYTVLHTDGISELG
jgi:pheromone shutdown protein TraB